MEKAFASAPFTKHGSSVDLFVLEIDNKWMKSKQKHRAHPSEILILSLEDVIKHRPVALEHLTYYQNIGSKCGVHLDDPIYEKFWYQWIINETVESSLDAAERLQSALNIETSSATKAPGRYKWEDIAKLVLRPHESVKPKPGSVEIFLTSVRIIADAVASTHDTEQFQIACAIEWIDLRLKKDPLKKKGSREILLTAMANAKELPFGSTSDQTDLSLQYLADSFPKAFDATLTPNTIAYVVYLLTAARTKKLKPETFNRIIHSLDSKSSSATFVTFVLATSLGIELTNQLIFALTQLNQDPIHWDMQS